MVESGSPLHFSALGTRFDEAHNVPVMNVERQRQIVGVASEALNRQGADRSAFLDLHCRADPELRRAVESLLNQRLSDSFLEEPAWGQAAAAGGALAPGTRLGHYEIECLIGAGGMGEVYRAHDVRLGRAVAVKVLPAVSAANTERQRRFEREARAASALNHPHICTIHG